MQGADFIQAISAAYDEVVHWRHNLFLSPSGKTGKQFTFELAKLFGAYGEGSALESIALKASVVIPALLLQKPHPTSNLASMWLAYNAVFNYGRRGYQQPDYRRTHHTTTQTNLHSQWQRQRTAVRRFTKLMLHGKVKAALRTLTDEANGGPLPMDAKVTTEGQPNTTVRDELLKKHPAGQPAYPEILLPLTTPATHPVVFDCLDGGVIRSAALRTHGSAGSSGVDAVGWRCLCTSFQNASSELCNSLAMVARKLCTTYVDPQTVAPLTASRLIALDKCPGVRPIGIGDTVRRIIGKAVLAVIKYDILDAAGALQLGASQEAGCEAVIHAMRNTFLDNDSEAVLLVDAFNSLNRQAALHNIHCTYNVCTEPHLQPLSGESLPYSTANTTPFRWHCLQRSAHSMVFVLNIPNYLTIPCFFFKTMYLLIQIRCVGRVVLSGHSSGY